jgi:NosR/NirI family nitrous oxide reductase transcriptional regulator
VAELTLKRLMKYRAMIVIAVVWGVGFAIPMITSSIAGASDDLRVAIKVHSLSSVFPDADHVGEIEGQPPTAPAFKDNKLIGYIYLTSDVVNSAGYSGKPVKILVGLDLGGKITGAIVHQHEEPILVLGIPDNNLDDYIAQFTGFDIRQAVHVGGESSPGAPGVDMVSGASITSHVFADSIMRAGRLVARSRGIIGESTAQGAVLELEKFSPKTWTELLSSGAIRQLNLTHGQIAAALQKTEGKQNSDAVFIDLYATLATPAGIGQNLFGFAEYNRLMSEQKAGTYTLFVASSGLYSFRGYAYRRSGFFERLQLVQGDKTIRLTKAMHRSLKKLAIDGHSSLRDISLFHLPSSTGFDPLQPWRLELLVEGESETSSKRFAGFPLNYVLPDTFIRKPPPQPSAIEPVDLDAPLWQVRWQNMMPEVIVLCIALTILLVLLVFQDWLVRYRKQVVIFRVGFLAFTLIFIGWMMSAQLSVINILTFAGALLTEFRWDFFLLEPLIFLLWGFVALVLLFWGRGVFCGWLCPFGALQELLNRVATRLGVRQYSLPFAVNERLWALKYVIFLGLFAVSLGPVEMAGKMIEVEPFKTVIALKFVRAWPFVAYAAMLLIVGLFINRFFCRYLCPLGAALAIPANNRMFDWLKRRHQCGTQCDVCALNCPVQAIHPNGVIDVHECIYCLNCQRNYHDDHVCPPLVELRKRREKRQAIRQG